jgi:two-component system, cell cycle sensor histidine kinase and response regulator CckA
MDVEFIRTHGFGRFGRYALLTVEDTGEGIDTDSIDRIFEPFYTTKEVGRGTGLGLSISYGIIKQHNGYIDVCSEVGKGTIFKIYIPLIEAKAEIAEAVDSCPVMGGNEEILLVEDNPFVRKAIKDTLESYGYRVTEAEDGVDAVAKFRGKMDKIRLALIDVIMPGMNGKEVYDDMRLLSPGIKAIFMSGYTSDSLTQKKIIEEGLEFIAKPSSPRELMKKIRDILDEKPFYY